MPEIVQMPARRAAVMHATATPAELPEVFARIFPAVYEALTRQGVTDMGHVISVYHTMDTEQMTISAGIEVGDGVEPGEPLELLEMPAGDVIKADHIGPYDQLAATHEAVWAFAQEQRRSPSAGPIERYITDPEAEPDPTKWHTQIILPLA